MRERPVPTHRRSTSKGRKLATNLVSSGESVESVVTSRPRTLRRAPSLSGPSCPIIFTGARRLIGDAVNKVVVHCPGLARPTIAPPGTTAPGFFSSSYNVGEGIGTIKAISIVSMVVSP